MHAPGKDGAAETVKNGTSAQVPGSSSKFVGRVNALRNLQLEAIKIESDLFAKIFDLEVEYAQKLKPLQEMRKQIVTGKHQPTEQESNCPVEIPEECSFFKNQNELLNKHLAGSGDATEDNVKGIPEFWLNVLKNSETISSMIQEYDEPVLQSLIDVTMEYVDPIVASNAKSFVIKFHFAENKYFENDVLTKQYDIRTHFEAERPFDFEGPEIVNCRGCVIRWKDEMNVTERMVRRKRVNKQTNRGTFVYKRVSRDSFFHFFSPPSSMDSCYTPDVASEDIDDIMEEHYEIGHYIREKLIPHAILLYTGESNDIGSSSGEDEEDSYDDDEEEEEGSRAFADSHRSGHSDNNENTESSVSENDTENGLSDEHSGDGHRRYQRPAPNA